MQCRGANKHRLFAGLATAFLLVFSLPGCGGMSESEQDAVEYADAEFRQKFIEDRERCQSSGRTIIINGDGARLDRNGIPKARVNYYCARMKFE